MSYARLASVIPLALFVGACEEDPSDPGNGGNNGAVVDCGAEVTSVEVTVSSGLTPEFDWSPRCRVALLLIEEGAHDKWALSASDGTNAVEPPVEYGVTPAGFPEAEAEPLETGHTYEVILWMIDGDSARILTIHEFER